MTQRVVQTCTVQLISFNNFVKHLILANFFIEGYYIYAEASWPRRSGDKARIGSGYLDAVSRGYCLMRFYYHLYGDHIGSLSVKTRTCKTCPGSVLWRRNNTAGNYWVRHAIYLRSPKPFQVIIT